MEFVLIGRGERVARRLRQVTEHKLARLERIEPRITRLEVEVIAEKNPRRGGIHRERRLASRNAGAGRVKSGQPPGGTAEPEVRSAE
jgi:ribosome-associated translation inhibitor RaiA